MVARSYTAQGQVVQTEQVRKQLIYQCRNLAVGGHSGVKAPCERLELHFYWPGMRQQVIQWLTSCETCQHCKTEKIPLSGLFQPLAVPTGAWSHVSLDFVEQLPKSEGKDTIMVVVDRFTKYSLVSLHHSFTAQGGVCIYINTIHKLHGVR